MTQFFFPLPIHSGQISLVDKKEVMRYVYKEKRKSGGIECTNQGGWHSHRNYHTFDNPLRQMVFATINKIFSDETIFNKGLDPRVTGLWININNKGNFNVVHDHPGCDMSGVLWLQTFENCGYLEFENPHGYVQSRGFGLYRSEYRDEKIMHPAYHLFPYDGGFVLFPSFLRHHVLPNQSNRDRISLSFNVEFPQRT